MLGCQSSARGTSARSFESCVYHNIFYVWLRKRQTNKETIEIVNNLRESFLFIRSDLRQQQQKNLIPWSTCNLKLWMHVFCQPCKKYILVVSEQFSKMDLFRRPKDLHPLPHLKVVLGIVEFLACSLFIVYCNICKLPTTSFHCSVSANISSDWSFMFSPSCAKCACKYLSAVFVLFTS